MQTRIFLSYAREDLLIARSLLTFLKTGGFDVWFDKESLHAGQEWRDAIERAIAAARLLLICISKSSVDKTGFVQKEMRLALEQAELRPFSQVYIVPITLDGTAAPRALSRWHVLDLREEDASQRLLDAIGNAISEDSKAPRSAHEALTSAIRNYGSSAMANERTGLALGAAAEEIRQLIEQEPSPDERGLVEILQEIRPGSTNFFPRIQYSGSPFRMKTRLFREAIGELISAGRLFPPEFNSSTNTRTYEYKSQ